MSNTTFTDNSTIIVAAFMNDVNDVVYEIIGDGVNIPTTAAQARTNLSAAKSGANTDITSLGGLTTALSIAQGGTGGTTQGTARTALGSTTVGDALFIATNAAAALTTLGIAAASDTAAGIVELATPAETSTGTDTTRAVTPAGLAGSSRVVSGTKQNTTSGSTIDFSGIPSWVKKVTLSLSGVSLNGTDNFLVQLGPGAVTTTGYIGTSVSLANTPTIGAAQFSTGFTIIGGGANVVVSGRLEFVLLDSATNTWTCDISCGRSDAAIALCGGGAVPLAGPLAIVRLTVSGANTFDAGMANITYE